ncbi:MAG: hypothetical protein WEB60_08300 [Terrimicrobiaceae bacterium]
MAVITGRGQPERYALLNEEESGPLPFEMAVREKLKHGGFSNPERYALLNEVQATRAAKFDNPASE